MGFNSVREGLNTIAKDDFYNGIIRCNTVQLHVQLEGMYVEKYHFFHTNTVYNAILKT
jgi:hypothetical protein